MWDFSGPARMKCPRRWGEAFSLIELLVAMAVLSLVLVMLVVMVNSVSTLWRRTTGKVSVFQEARAGFEAMTRKVSQATLNTYWDYTNSAGVTRTDFLRANPGADPGSFALDQYARASELHFVTGQAASLLPSGRKTTGHAVFFQAPLGYSVVPTASAVELQQLLNATGFFIELADASSDRPNFLNSILPSQERYRLMEVWQPSEELSVYSATGNDWFAQPLRTTPEIARPIAENVIAMVVWPQRARQDPGAPITTDYGYDTRAYLGGAGVGNADVSRNQLPPLLQITLVAIDENSASRLAEMPPGEKTILSAGQLFTSVSGSTPDAQETRYRADLAKLEQFLQSKQLNYRIFTSAVPIKQAKWSE